MRDFMRQNLGKYIFKVLAILIIVLFAVGIVAELLIGLGK